MSDRRISTRIPLCLVVLALIVVAGGQTVQSQGPPKLVLKSESFDKDPGWEGFNNRIVPTKVPKVTQAFGYSATNFAGKDKGEIGGRISRSATPAYYADAIAVKTLNDKPSASGTFAITAPAGDAGITFGWFNSEQPSGTGRPVNSLGLSLGIEATGARLAVLMLNATNKTCGPRITPFIPGKFRPTPIKNDGTRYSWTLDYDPDANGGDGRFQFTLQSHGAKPDPFDAKLLPADLPEAHRKVALSHFPNTTTFSFDLPAGFKKEGACFDRFGLINLMKPGNATTIHFDDLQYDGKKEDFAKEPGWTGSNNRATYEDLPLGAHNFGYSPKTNFAGGIGGEIGGDVWRTDKYSYYADKIGNLTLDDR